MHKTKQDYAKMILEDDAILEAFEYADSEENYEKLIENILAKYEMLRILRG